MAWTTIPDSDVDPESPITTSLMQALRDNPIAIAGALSGAPDVIQVDAVLDKIRFKTVQIGDWDMDATGTLAVNHGLTGANIRSVFVAIRNDAATNTYPIDVDQNLDGNVAGGFLWTATQVSMGRIGAGFFDGTDFDATTYNRGWITIVYAVP